VGSRRSPSRWMRRRERRWRRWGICSGRPVGPCPLLRRDRVQPNGPRSPSVGPAPATLLQFTSS
jgi:hypothetical protein